jgi:integrase
MLKAGVPIHVVSQFLGHSNVQITLDTYAHVLPGQDEDAVTALVAEYS